MTDSNNTLAPVTLTAKEVKVLWAILLLAEERDEDQGVFTMDVAEQVDMSARSLGGVFASLVKKSLLWADVYSDINDRTCNLTESGKLAANAIG